MKINNLTINTSFVTPHNLKEFMEMGFVPFFIVRNISGSNLICKYSGTPVHLKDLSPSTELFQDIKNRRIERPEFNTRYLLEVGSVAKIETILERINIICENCGATGAVLMGYGYDENKCHRSVLSEFINSLGILDTPIKEVKL